MEPKDSMHPFSSGTQYQDWRDANCERCTRGNVDDDPFHFPCDIEKELFDALWRYDDRIPLPMAERMGAAANEGKYNWRCGEFQERG